MYKNIRKLLLPFLGCLLAISFVAFVAVTAWGGVDYFAYADGSPAQMTVLSANADDSKYKQTAYKNVALIPNSKISSKSCDGGAQNNYGLNGAFDGQNNTFWISKEGNTDTFKNSVTVIFTETVKFRDLFYKSSYYTPDVRHFSGYPTKLNIYAANGDDNFVLVGTCESEPRQDFSETTIFSLPKDIKCDRLKIEFAEVSVYENVFGGAAVAAAMDFAFYRSGDDVYKTVKATGNHVNASYLSYNAVSSDEMKIRSNGGGLVSNAFDGSGSTYWTSESYNTDIFTNKVTLTMTIPQTISNIVYACSYYTRDGVRNFSGFPTEFKVTVTDGNDNKSVYIFIGKPGNDWTHADFAFPKSVTCKKLELEFIDLTTFGDIANGNPVVSTGEIFLIKSGSEASEAMIARINGVFADYAQYEIKEGVTVDTLNQMREEARLISNYEQSLKPTLDRAEAILKGAMKKDPYREFSTDPEAKNPIEQYGALASYCRNDLHMSSFGTDRQVIGIGGTTGETITIYVEAGENDPLPQVAFTQIYGSWQSWLSTYELQRGKNEITFPNFKAGSGYSVAVNAGGPIHIINPYTYPEQSHNVKLYFEGGYVYPVFHDDDDEGTFKVILKDYYERLMDPNDTSITIDAFEAVTDNVILSTKASSAYDAYVRRGNSPQNNVNKWKDYTKTTLAFGGVEFDSTKPYYNKKNERIKVNYRTVQPYAGFYAFAATEHVGLPSSDLHGAMVTYWTLGWAFYHEMGHQLDNRRMMIGEVTNNMWAIYNIYMVNKKFENRINVTNVSKNLASDLSSYVGNYWDNGHDNCDFWWILEGAHPGYWARLQQLYNNEWHTTALDTAITDNTERLCYYSSLAIGEDASAYFERFGFHFSGNKKFTAAGASQAFKNAMNAAKANNRIKDTNKKYWYVNNGQYIRISAHGNKLEESWGSCYSSSQTVSGVKFMGTSGSYTLLLPEPQKPEAHLCYEIQSYIDGGWKVIGVTDGTSFNDSRNYGGATPRYRVYAYDRFFNSTGDPQEVSPETKSQTRVCRIGDTYYDTLKAAVAAANADTTTPSVTIYLLKDFEDGNITFSRPNKNITVLPAEGLASVTITKNAPGDLFNMVWGDVKIGSANNNVPTSAPIILDGGSFSQSGSLIRTRGKNIYLNNITLQNNINTGSGGGLSLEYGSSQYINGCIIKNNRAANGGGLATYSYASTEIRGLTIIDNVATGLGGGIYAGSGEYSTTCRQVSNKYPEIVISGNRAANGGGIYAERTIELINAQIINNIATQNGGGVYSSVDNSSRYLKLVSSTVEGNTAVMGDAIYIYRGTVQFAGATVSGMLFKNYGTSPASRLELREALSDFTECTIRVSKTIPIEGLTLCEVVTGIQPDQITEPAAAYRVYNGRAEFVSGTGVVLFPTTAKATINYSGKSYELDVPLGAFTLPARFDGLPENMYVEKYTVGGEHKAVGASITVSGNFTAEAVVKKYCTLTLSYGKNSSETHTLKQGDTYYLPMKTPDGETLFGWNSLSDKKYYAYAEGVTVTSDIELEAVIKQLHSVKTVVNGVETVSKYEYGGSMTLPSPDAIFGKVFSHWEIEGKKYAANHTLTVTRDMVATAIYTNSWVVTTVVEDDEISKTYPNGAAITLSDESASLGREFKYWMIDGVKYYAGSVYTVNKDCEIIAVFSQVSKDEKITVKLSVNKGALYDEEGNTLDTIVENEVTTKEYDFNYSFRFTKPDVNPGNEFLYWEVNGARYDADTSIIVKEPFTAVAVVAKIQTEEQPKTTATVKIKSFVAGVYSESVFEYPVGIEFTLELPIEQPENSEFLHWEVDGVAYEIGDKITVSKDMQVVAVYKNLSNPDNPGGGDGEQTNGGGGSQAGLIAGIVVGVVVALGGAAAAVIIILKKKKKQ